MHKLSGTIQRYDWGTTDAIPKLLRREPDGVPFAEYWLGAHDLAPSQTACGSLATLLRENPEALGARNLEAFGVQLPFLVKFLSAARPLSLQAHPTREQAEEGFAREDAAGVAITSRERVYCDNWPKPEILVALDTFETLNGFRDPRRTAELFAGLGVADELASVIGPLTERKGAAALAEVFLDVLSVDGARAHLVDVVGSAAVRHVNDDGPLGEFARTAVELDGAYPGDRGILAALLLNRVTLAPGEGYYVAPGQMHAYLRGTGIEVMATSDNVIRGGLTAKHIDVAELVRVVDFTPVEPKIVRPESIRPGVERYDTPCQEFDVWRVTAEPGQEPVRLPGSLSARIVLVVSGEVALAGDDSTTLASGEAVFLRADEADATLSGDGVAFVTSSGLR